MPRKEPNDLSPPNLFDHPRELAANRIRLLNRHDHWRGDGGIMSEHTAGPWTTESDDRAIFAGMQVIARVYFNDGRHEAESRANANLMAAAPEMLAALRAVFDSGALTPQIDSALIAQIEAAIDKAEGESA